MSQKQTCKITCWIKPSLFPEIMWMTLRFPLESEHLSGWRVLPGSAAALQPAALSLDTVPQMQWGSRPTAPSGDSWLRDPMCRVPPHPSPASHPLQCVYSVMSNHCDYNILPPDSITGKILKAGLRTPGFTLKTKQKQTSQEHLKVFEMLSVWPHHSTPGCTQARCLAGTDAA